jgi:hypothetical protein
MSSRALPFRTAGLISKYKYRNYRNVEGSGQIIARIYIDVPGKRGLQGSSPIFWPLLALAPRAPPR